MAETENTATTEKATATEETTTETATEQTEAPAAPEAEEEEISYHAVEKEGHVTAIWEMQGRKHHRTIDPRSTEGKHILSLFTSEHHEEAA
jgi:hypothetical protein